MGILQRLAGTFRRRPLTSEELEARAEAKLLREQINQDKLSQLSGGGQVYRSGRR